VVWDLNAQTAIWDIAHQAPPQIAGRGFAMVSGAVYDAVNAIEGTPYEPYLVAPAASGRESAGAAAYRVLDAIFPEQRERLRVQYDDWLAGLPDGPAKRGGIRVGTQAAAAMITARAGRRRRRSPALDRRRGAGSVPAHAARLRKHRCPGRFPEAVRRPGRDDVPDAGAAGRHEPRVRPRLRGGEVARLGDEHGPHRRPDRGGALVARPAVRQPTRPAIPAARPRR
jgi:hypothetical protein